MRAMRSSQLLAPLLVTAPLALVLAGCPGPEAMLDAGPGRPDAPRADAARPDSGLAPDAGALPPAPLDLLADLADPFAPARLRSGTPFLVSSRQPEEPEGLLNADYGHFEREEEGRGVMIDRRGPGVITRWWMTIGNLPGPRDPEAIRVRFWVDGAEIDPDGGEPGMTLGALTDGTVSSLASPFTLGREGTSGGFVVSQPIHYQESFRADVALNAGWTYYQLEGFDYDAPTEVVPFSYPPSAEQLANVEAAAMLWRDHDHPGTEQLGEPTALEASASTELRWMGPGVLTTLALEVPRAAREDTELVIQVDGEEVARAPLAWLAGGEDPAAESHASALFVVDPTQVRLHYPIPFELELVASLTNTGAATIGGVRMAGRVVSMPLDPDLGRFHAQCDTHGPVAAIQMCGTMDPSLRTPNNVIASWSGARGHYVGHSMIQRAASAWWCALEPDHEIFIDGAYALLGTGMEDYYSAGFYFMNGPVSWALAGASGWTRSTVDGSGATHVFRHHLVDTIPFSNELRFEYESYVEDTTFTGCSFFYVEPG